MTSADSLSLILRRMDEIERKLDRMMEELRPTAIGYSARRGNLPKKGRWQRRTNVWRRVTNPRTGPMRLRSGPNGHRRAAVSAIKPTTKDHKHDTLTALHRNDPRA
jgi:hypothetical protein